jgi:hypothetical protein
MVPFMVLVAMAIALAVNIARKWVRRLGIDDTSAIGTAMIAGIVAIIVGGIVYMLGVFLVSTVNGAIPLVTSGALNTTQSQAQTNIASAFNIVGIGLVVGGIIAILYEILPIAAMFMGGRRG